jgi:hypothetical protein
MTEKKYNLINNLTGWILFLVAAFTYLSTIEPTVPLWDCGEFIAGSYKLEVVHPPGAPFFLMLNHIFTMFAPSLPSISVLVNGASAIESAFCILFLFWTITLLGRKFWVKDIQSSSFAEILGLIGAGIIGALAYTFSDSFWFSAVESEVYAFSSFFIAIVFWLLLKWERRADEPYNLRWLILIGYLMGLSIGVHLLSLLALPVIAIVYYFRKTEKVTVKGIIFALIIGLVILGVVNIVIIRWLPLIASRFDLLFVNTFGFPFWSGVIFFLMIVLAGLAYAVYYTWKKQRPLMNAIYITMIMIIIGFSSYVMVPIRSLDNPPIDYSNPDDIFNLMAYLNREQYGDRPLIYGPPFTAEVIDSKEGKMQYSDNKETGKYEELGRKQEPVYDKSQNTIFPRMGDTRADRKQAYRSWAGMKKTQKKPTFTQNIKFFFEYQIGTMYWRYFAWNFIGRQNDEQGNGRIVPSWFRSGNWLSGIDFIDEARLGSQKDPPFAQRTNKAHNTLFFLPFLLGLLGLYFHYKKTRRDFFIVFALFFITGILLILYQNQPPFEPRERDYVLVGSFYVFTIWIGFGLLGLINLLRNRVKVPLIVTTVALFILCFIAVPARMANQEWDDHDRSERYTTRDFALNYLNSCDSNAILFTNGDNDTYPPWYCQEVENLRSDIRVINLQLLMTDWYSDQLRRPANTSTPVIYSIPQEKIPEGTRDYIGYFDNPRMNIDKNAYYDLKEIVNFMTSDNPDYMASTYSGTSVNYMPTKKYQISVDSAKVVNNGTVRKVYAHRIPKYLQWEFKGGSIYKNSLMQLDMIASNDWDRPIYWAITSGDDTYLGLEDWFQQEGMTYRLVPIRKQADEKDGNEAGRVDPVIMYDNIMTKFKWGNLENPNIYIDGVTRRHLNNYRNVFSTVGKRLLALNEKKKVEALVDKCLEVLPENHIPHELNSIQLSQLYYLADCKDKGLKLNQKLSALFIEELDYFMTLNTGFRKDAQEDIQRDMYGLQIIENMSRGNDQIKFADEIAAAIKKYQTAFGSLQQQQ